MLSDATLRNVSDAALNVGLDRDTLLASLDRRLAGGLAVAPNLRDQLLLDLYGLKNMGVLTDGSVPLRNWLVQASYLAKPRREAAVFEAAIVELDGALPLAGSAGGGTSEEPTHTSIVLDRVVQWDMLVKRCRVRDREHLAFLVHGSADQDLHLFLRRIHHYLNEECAWLHSIVKVERSREEPLPVRPTSGNAAWCSRVWPAIENSTLC